VYTLNTVEVHAVVADPISAREGRTASHAGNNPRPRNVVAFDTTQITHPDNRSNPAPGDPAPTLVRGAPAPALAFEERTARSGRGYGEDLSPALTAAQAEGGSTRRCVASAEGADWAVRRLTPRECERLQGFPDDHTLIPWKGRAREACPDGPRYRAVGNAIAVPVLAWIGRRIARVDRIMQARQ
jgi:DNA (cytosine-5)-methyltransferase 1